MDKKKAYLIAIGLLVLKIVYTLGGYALIFLFTFDVTDAFTFVGNWIDIAIFGILILIIFKEFKEKHVKSSRIFSVVNLSLLVFSKVCGLITGIFTLIQVYQYNSNTTHSPEIAADITSKLMRLSVINIILSLVAYIVILVLLILSHRNNSDYLKNLDNDGSKIS